MKKFLKNKKALPIIILVIAILVILFIIIFRYEVNVVKKKTPYVDDKENNTSNAEQQELAPENYEASVPIFMYHFILEDYGDNPDVENFMKPSTLEEQIKYIVDNNYQTIFESELGRLYKYTKPVALTFDDCFVYFYNNAFPLVKKYKVKVTLNLIYNYLNGENYLTDDQVKEMLDTGLVEIESHTLSHKELTTLSIEEQRKQILDSKKNFEEKFGVNLSTLCYPVGDYNEETINIVKEQYNFGLAMTGGVYHTNIHTNKYKIPRIYANRSMDINTFANYLKQSKVVIH